VRAAALSAARDIDREAVASHPHPKANEGNIMSASVAPIQKLTNLPFYQERVDLAAAFRWTARLGMHEAVANHFSLAVSDDGTRFLMNPNQVHFSLIKASSLLLLDATDPNTMGQPDAPDPTAWGLHGSIHRHLPHARCVMHVHSIHATVLASLADSRLLPIDQNCATFFNRYVIDENYGGLAFEDEGERCARLLENPKHKVMIMGSHGVLVIGKSVADAFNRMYYFERAAETYIKALQTGQKLRILSDEIAEKVAAEIEEYPGQAERHLADLKTLLERQEPDYLG
jgi:ribulose-5-phosphate 4-epimerase/fuculose-1-phosphate aldolase